MKKLVSGLSAINDWLLNCEKGLLQIPKLHSDLFAWCNLLQRRCAWSIEKLVNITLQFLFDLRPNHKKPSKQIVMSWKWSCRLKIMRNCVPIIDYRSHLVEPRPQTWSELPIEWIAFRNHNMLSALAWYDPLMQRLNWTLRAAQQKECWFQLLNNSAVKYFYFTLLHSKKLFLQWCVPSASNQPLM